MTSVQTHPTSNFGPSAIEDPMEITSDMDRGLETGEDIDIDLDLTAENQAQEEDDHMLEDISTSADQRQVSDHNLPTGNDDEMADELYEQGSGMERSSIQDENLEDAEDISPEEIEGRGHDTEEGAPSILDPDFVSNEEQADGRYQIDREQYEQSDDVGAGYRDQGSDIQNDYLEEKVDTTSETFENQQRDPNDNHEEALVQDGLGVSHQNNVSDQSNETVLSTANLDAPNSNIQETQNNQENEDVVTSTAIGLTGVQATPSLTPEKTASTAASGSEESPDGSLLKSGSALQDPNESAIQNETQSKEPMYVHPVVVMYQENEISLFPPTNAEDQNSTYFLEDEQLAGEAITKLLGACRSVLGDSISVQDEILIDIDELGLHIREFASESSTTTLLDLTDIYIQLQHFDGCDDPPPLFMQLTTKPRFSQRLEYLMNAVAEEKGLSLIEPACGIEESSEGEVKLEPDSRHDHSTKDHLELENESSQHLQGDEEPNKAFNDTTPTANTEPVTHPGSSNPGFQASKYQSSIIPETSQTDGKPEIISTHDTASQAAKGGDHALQAYETNTVPAQLTSSLLESPQQAESSTNDEDFIDYDEDEHEELGTSSGSSTLQGDHLDSMHSESNTNAEESLGAKEISERQVFNGTGTESSPQSKSEAVGIPETDLVDSRQDGELIEDDLDYSEHDEEPHDGTTDWYDNEVGSPRPLENSDNREENDALSPHASDEREDGEAVEFSEIAVPAQLDGQQDQDLQTDLDINDSHPVLHLDEQLQEVDQAKSVNADERSGNLAHEDNLINENVRELNQTSESERLPELGEKPLDAPQNAGLSSSTFDPKSSENEDVDEITYEDDKSKVDSPGLSSEVGISTTDVEINTLKRTRSHHDDDGLEGASQDVKRIRSG